MKCQWSVHASSVKKGIKGVRNNRVTCSGEREGKAQPLSLFEYALEKNKTFLLSMLTFCFPFSLSAFRFRSRFRFSFPLTVSYPRFSFPLPIPAFCSHFSFKFSILTFIFPYTFTFPFCQDSFPCRTVSHLTSTAKPNHASPPFF